MRSGIAAYAFTIFGIVCMTPQGFANDKVSAQPLPFAIRYGDGSHYFWRYENEWPLARTVWTPYYLHADTGALSLAPQISVAKVDYPSKTGAIIFFTPPFMENTEITGPIRLKLWVSSTTDAVDLFV